jgi:hypothetical protein
VLFAMYDAPQASRSSVFMQSPGIVPFVANFGLFNPPEFTASYLAQVGVPTSNTDVVEQLDVSHAGSYSVQSGQAPAPGLDGAPQPSQEPQQTAPEEGPADGATVIPSTPGDQAAMVSAETGITYEAASEDWINSADTTRTAQSSDETNPDGDQADLSAVLAGFTGWSAANKGGSLPRAGQKLLNRDGFKKLKDGEDKKRFRLFGGR